WINGWGTKNYGRVWKLDVTEETNDLKKEREKTKELMLLDYKSLSNDDLLAYLRYEDMRIRQKAQFELASRGSNSAAIFQQAIKQTENQLARVHGIWGMGQLAASDKSHAAAIASYLSDSDEEIIVQVLKVLGDVRFEKEADTMVALLKSSNPRIRFFAAQALGRIAYKGAVDPLLEMIDQNNDEDLYLRHAGVLALSRIGDEGAMTALINHPERDMRIAAVLVLRKLQSEKLALFLNDADEYIVTEAARAINDDWSVEAALPALAGVLSETRFTSVPLLRRAINAALRVGGEKELDLLINFSQRKEVSSDLRAEAMAALGTWTNPSVMDRVDGRYRGEVKRDSKLIIQKLSGIIPTILKEKENKILLAATEMMANLGMKEFNNQLAAIFSSHASAAVRAALVSTLQKLDYEEMTEVIKKGMKDGNAEVRRVAISLLGTLEVSGEELPEVIQPIIDKGSIGEQQQLISVLGNMPLDKTKNILETLVIKRENNELPTGLWLELTEAVEAVQAEDLIRRLKEAGDKNSALVEFAGALEGGDSNAGRGYFFWNSAGQCMRCHSIGDEGDSDVGPNLAGIGRKLSREQLLEALVEPSIRIAPGYGNVTLELDDGQTVTGLLMEETEEKLTLHTSNAEPLEIPVSRIVKRTNSPSSMPAMGRVMSKHELRNLIEFLSGLD
ncbi:MAG: HEAT repeat domain-containing protein, partial [Cyclobacteriaceae bacterium]|nr:HEAT repeat domain-containing protein [Cyclobacteriaceae bacterium]